MKIWTVFVEDDFGNVSDTYCFTEKNHADEFCTYVNKESNAKLTAYRPIENKIYEDLTGPIFDFDQSYGN